MAGSDTSYEESAGTASEDEVPTEAGEVGPKLKGIERILCKATDKPDEYSFLKEPGAAKVQNFDSNTELYIFTIPSRTIDPMSLVNTKIVIGGTKEQNLNVQQQQYRIVTCENSSVADTSTLFLPDEKGELHKVNSVIKGRVMIRGQPKDLDNHSRINIDALRCVQHTPPTNIRERNFWSSIDNEMESKVIKNTVKEVDEALTRSAKKKKKKKKKHHESMDFDGGSQAEEAMDVNSSLNISTMHKKKVKKSKCQEGVNLDSSAENHCISDDMFEDSPKKKKKFKSFNVTV